MFRLTLAARGQRPVSMGLGLVLWFCVMAAAGCGTSTSLPDRGIIRPTPQHFAYCRNHTCETVETLTFDDAQWRAIKAPLDQPADSAAEERARIAEVVALYERIAAVKAGTTNDRGGTIVGFFRSGQLDCVDEASNTDTLLIMLDNEGLLHWHRRGPPRMRLVILSDGVPHVTATIVDKETGDTFAVDSWFRDNGEPADVVPLQEWLDGWNPPEPVESK